MSTLDGNNLFSSGPHSIHGGPWQRDLVRRGFAGVDGELLVDLGLRGRNIVQTGRLQAADIAGLLSQIDAIRAKADGQEHTLDAGQGPAVRVVIENFKPGPLLAGRGFFCDYEITYRQSA
jgi:hypothetical protein